jgi:hypothetical protein
MQSRLEMHAQRDAPLRMMAPGALILLPSQFERHHAGSYGAAAVSSKSMCSWRDIVAFILPSRRLVRAKQSRATGRLDRFAASGSLVEVLRDNCTSQRYQEVGMTGSLTWLALVGLITILYVKKFWTRDRVLGFGTTDPLMGFGDISHLVVPFYFTKRGFENMARIIKR